jgi:hypothetical protein
MEPENARFLKAQIARCPAAAVNRPTIFNLNFILIAGIRVQRDERL